MGETEKLFSLENARVVWIRFEEVMKGTIRDQPGRVKSRWWGGKTRVLGDGWS